MKLAEYIDREKARSVVCGMCRYEGTSNCDECEHPIDDIPADDVKPVVYGEWVYDDNGYDWGIPAWRCSKCYVVNSNIPPFIQTKDGIDKVNPYLFSGSQYCPTCGARMDLSEKKNG